jgi:hypothetical protein
MEIEAQFDFCPFFEVFGGSVFNSSKFEV